MIFMRKLPVAYDMMIQLPLQVDETMLMSQMPVAIHPSNHVAVYEVSF